MYRSKLEKSGSSSKMLSAGSKLLSREELETLSMSSTSTKSKQEEETSDDEESYNVERIKWLEEFGSSAATRPDGMNPAATTGAASGQSRYKKAYKSFKNVIKRNTPSTSMITNGLATIQNKSRSAISGKKSSDNLVGSLSDINNNNILNNNNNNNKNGYLLLDQQDAHHHQQFSNSSKNDLIFFQDDYSYESQPKNKPSNNHKSFLD